MYSRHILCFALFLLTGLAPVQAGEIVILPTRAGVTLSYLLLQDTSAPPQAVAVLLPGGEGVLHLPADMRQLQLGYRGNFPDSVGFWG